MGILKADLFEKLVEDATETIKDGGTYAAEFDDALVIIELEDETFKVHVIMGEPARYEGNILNLD